MQSSALKVEVLIYLRGSGLSVLFPFPFLVLDLQRVLKCIDAAVTANTEQVWALNPMVNLGKRGLAPLTDLKAVNCSCCEELLIRVAKN